MTIKSPILCVTICLIFKFLTVFSAILHRSGQIIATTHGSLTPISVAKVPGNGTPAVSVGNLWKGEILFHLALPIQVFFLGWSHGVRWNLGSIIMANQPSRVPLTYPPQK